MNTVTPLTGKATPHSVDDVLNWLAKKAERGELGENAARLRATAIRQMVSILQPDEPQDARAVLDNIQDLARRWATKNNANGGTARTYASRAKGSLEDYLRWVEDPVGFRFKRTGDDSTGDKPAKAKPRKPAASSSASASHQVSSQAGTAPAHAPPTPAQLPRNFPLGEEAFEFRLPSNGITMHDWKRIACHLMTLAVDFDPSVPQHASQMASIVKAEV